MKNSFSLIESVLYVGFAAIIIPLLAYFLFSSTQLMSRNQALLEVERTANFITQTITQNLRNADTIINPLLGESSSTLSLVVFTQSGATTTMEFSLKGGQLALAESGNGSVWLTTTSTAISGLLFSNASRGGTPGSIRLQFTVTKDSYAKIYYAGGSLRKH